MTSMRADSPVEYDIMVFGAATDVGRLVVSYLATHCDEDQRLALIDGDQLALQRTRTHLGEWGRKVSVEVADISEAEKLTALVTSTEVVLNALGDSLGSELLRRQCVKSNADYVAFEAVHKAQIEKTTQRMISLPMPSTESMAVADHKIVKAKLLSEIALYLSKAEGDLPAAHVTHIDQASALFRQLQAVGIPADLLSQITATHE